MENVKQTKTLSSVKVTESNFDQLVTKSKIPVLVDFWADWCPPCKTIAPSLDMLARKYKGQLVVGKVDVEGNEKLATRYGIQALPTLLLFKQDKVIAQFVGAVSKATIEKELKKHL